jgi:hypothetical protein
MAGKRPVHTLSQRTIEVGNERNNDVRPGLSLMTFKQMDDGGMIEPDDGVKNREDLRGTKGPTVFQEEVVNGPELLHWQPC